MSSAEDWRPLLRNALVTELERTPSALTFRLRLVRQTSCLGMFVLFVGRLEPSEEFEFTDACAESQPELVAALFAGLREGFGEAGRPVRFTLLDDRTHAVDSTERGHQLAGRLAAKYALEHFFELAS
ncbi:MAG TPA: hypothetical protein DEA08_12400 [Planctomycetes bacterium]|nr:hypothetical protein [Planctomycetota bacterium]